MKNKLLLAALTITLLFTIVACGHIDTQPAYFAEITHMDVEVER